MSLVSRLNKFLRKPILLVSIFPFLSGCPNPSSINPITNSPPQAILSLAPTSVQAHLEVQIQVNGQDHDGKSDIVEYKVGEDKNDDGDIDDSGELIQSSSTPIDEGVTFDESGIKKIYGQVTDSQGAIGKDGPIYIDVSPAPGDPTVDLSSIPGSEKIFNEEQQTIINLPTPTDINLGDNPPYISATSLDGKVTPVLSGDTLNGYQLTVQGKLNEIGNYQIQLRFGSVGGGIGNATLEGIIANLVDLSGIVEDTKIHAGAPGKLWACKDLEDTIPIGQAQTDTEGNFNFQLDQLVSEFYLRGKITDFRDSFKRTVRFASADLLGYKTIPFSGEDKSGLIIRAMPSDKVIEAGISKEDFNNHYGRTTTGTFVNPELGRLRWIDGGPSEVVIFPADPLNRGTFTSGEQIFFEEKITDPTNIPKVFRGRVINVEMNPLEGTHYYIGQGEVRPFPGRILAIRNLTIGPGGVTELYGSGVPGYIQGAVIYMRIINGAIFSHEFLHAQGSRWEDTVIPPQLSLLSDKFVIGKPGIIDEERGFVQTEENYVGREYADNILGVD